MSRFHALSLPDVLENARELFRVEFQPPSKNFTLSIGYKKKKGIKFNREDWDQLYKHLIAYTRPLPGGDFALRYMLGTLIIGPSPQPVQQGPAAPLTEPVRPIPPIPRYNSGNTLNAQSRTELETFFANLTQYDLQLAAYQQAVSAPQPPDSGILYVDPESNGQK